MGEPGENRLNRNHELHKFYGLKNQY